MDSNYSEGQYLSFSMSFGVWIIHRCVSVCICILCTYRCSMTFVSFFEVSVWLIQSLAVFFLVSFKTLRWVGGWVCVCARAHTPMFCVSEIQCCQLGLLAFTCASGATAAVTHSSPQGCFLSHCDKLIFGKFTSVHRVRSVSLHHSSFQFPQSWADLGSFIWDGGT